MGLLLAAIFVPFIGAGCMPLLYRPLGRRLGIAALAFALATLVLVVLTPAQTVETLQWVPQLGIDLTIQVDGWSRLLGLLISGIGSLVFLYSILYLGAREDLGKFYLYILMFMGAMLGVVFSGNLMVLYVFWELTSISSFLLIGFWYTTEAGSYGALKSMVLTVGAGLVMLAGITILGNIAGTYEMAGLLAQKGQILAHPLAGTAMVLILIGALAKSAQVPFHIWLPDAMAAPTPVSAYLHSATMVKAGLFLIARLWPLFSDHVYWSTIVGTVGLLTMVVGSYQALQKTDLKAILAMSTVSQLGLIATLFGFGTEEAAAAGVFHLLNHSTFKGLLFMVAGIIDHETGTRDIRQLSGLRRSMPVAAVLACIGAASMAGVPLLNGFLSKEMFLAATLSSPFGVVAAVVATGASVLTTAYCLILAHKVFFGPQTKDTPKRPHEAPWLMLLPPAVLAVLVVGIGVYPGLVADSIVRPAVAAVLQAEPNLHIAIWHGVNPALFMSLIALGGGLVVYLSLPRLAPVFHALSSPTWNFNRLYDWLWWREQVVEKVAKRITNAQMTGLLRDYMVFTLGGAALFLLGTIWYKGIGLGTLNLAPVTAPEALLLGVVLVGAIVVVRARTRLMAMAGLGLIGLPLSLWFVMMRAPDLALTQLVIEAVTAVLFLLVFAHLPQLSDEKRPPLFQSVNLLVSLGVGLVAGLFTLMANGQRAFPPDIAQYYLDNSSALAGGNNVVNVTLVDFRGFDTMGEITVLAVGGLAIFALIRLRLAKGGKRS